MNNGGGLLLAGLTGLITIATWAIIVSQKAQTSSVISALGTGIATDIGAATAPVTGATSSSSSTSS
jgi:hypothetical protein